MDRRVDVRIMVLPALVLVLGLWVSALRGPFHYGDSTDPEYVYLLNAVNVLTLKSPGHVDHPGTTLQVGLAGVVLARHLAGCATGGECTTLPFDVLSKPEPYLRAASFLLVTMISLLLLGMGVFIHRHTGAFLPAVVMQGMAFTFPIVLQSMGRVTPEPVMLIVSLLYLAPFLVAALRRADGAEWTDAELERMAVWTGVLLAVGVVTKITFIPHVVMVFALPGWRLRRRFVLSAVAAGLVLILPVWHKIPTMLGWAQGLLVRSGYYGSGEVGLPSFEKLTANALELHDKEPMYGVWLLAVALAVWVARAVRREVLLALVGALVMLALTVKHPQQRYLIPGMGLLTFSTALLLAHLRGRRVAIGLAAVLGLMSLWSLWTGITGWIDTQSNYASTAKRFETMAAQAGEGCVVYHHYGSSDPVAALQFGDSFSEAAQRGILELLYPGFRMYNQFSGRFAGFSDRDYTADVTAKIAAGGCVLIQGQGDPPWSLPSALGLGLEELGSNGWLFIRRVTYNPVGQPVEASEPGGSAIRIEVASIRSGNVIVDRTTFVQDIAVLTSPQPPGWAEFEVTLPAGGVYEVRARYATEEARPVKMMVNGKLVVADLGRLPTGGYGQQHQKWTSWGEHELPGGKVTVRLESDRPFPHIHQIAFVPAGS